MTRSSDKSTREGADLSSPDNVPPLSRRAFTAWTAGAALGLAWSSGLRGAAAQGVSAAGGHKLPEIGSVSDRYKGSGQVIVSTWGGIGTEMQRTAFYEPFTKLTGIKVVEATGPAAAKIRAMVEAGRVEWDVCQSARNAVMELQGIGSYFHDIDYGLIEDSLSSTFRHPQGVDMLPYAQVYAYRSDIFKDRKPATWSDFWDAQKFPGPRTMPVATDGNYPELVGALLADGVPRDKVYPIDIDRAFKSLDRVKPHVVKWWNTGAIPLQMLADKEAVLAVVWNARLAALQAAKVPVEIAWDGGTLFNNCWAVPKGAPNLDNAMKFIGFTTMAISQARYSMLLPYGYTNAKAAEYIPADVAVNLPTHPANFEKLILQDVPWWTKNRGAVIDRWNRWILQ